MAGPGIIFDRVEETTTTVLTADYVLLGAAAGYQSFAVVGNTNQCYYAVTDGTNWETGIGTYSTTGPTLARTTVQTSSNGNAAVSWGAGTKTIWLDATAAYLNQISSVVINAQAAGYTFLGADKAKLVQFTGSADATFAFTAAATLGANWWCYFQNAGTAQARITLDPNASELIDGLTSYKSYPGEVRLITCTGGAFTSIVLHGFQMRYLSTVSNDPVPPGYTRFLVDIWAGGGAGGCRATTGNAAGGAGGAHWGANYLAADIGATWTATVGAGAAAVASSNANGGVGGQTTFTPLTGGAISCFGGGGGGSNAAGSTAGGGGGGGQGSAGTSGNLTSNGTPGNGINSTDTFLGTGGGQVLASFDGGAGSNGVGTATGTVGVRSLRGGCSGAGTSSGDGAAFLGGLPYEMGGKGGDVATTGVATAGAQPGGGGAGGRNGHPSGKGGDGEVRIVGVV